MVEHSLMSTIRTMLECISGICAHGGIACGRASGRADIMRRCCATRATCPQQETPRPTCGLGHPSRRRSHGRVAASVLHLKQQHRGCFHRVRHCCCAGKRCAFDRRGGEKEEEQEEEVEEERQRQKEGDESRQQWQEGRWKGGARHGAGNGGDKGERRGERRAQMRTGQRKTKANRQSVTSTRAHGVARPLPDRLLGKHLTNSACKLRERFSGVSRVTSRTLEKHPPKAVYSTIADDHPGPRCLAARVFTSLQLWYVALAAVVLLVAIRGGMSVFEQHHCVIPSRRHLGALGVVCRSAAFRAPRILGEIDRSMYFQHTLRRPQDATNMRNKCPRGGRCDPSEKYHNKKKKKRLWGELSSKYGP